VVWDMKCIQMPFLKISTINAKFNLMFLSWHLIRVPCDPGASV